MLCSLKWDSNWKFCYSLLKRGCFNSRILSTGSKQTEWFSYIVYSGSVRIMFANPGYPLVLCAKINGVCMSLRSLPLFVISCKGLICNVHVSKFIMMLNKWIEIHFWHSHEFIIQKAFPDEKWDILELGFMR